MLKKFRVHRRQVIVLSRGAASPKFIGQPEAISSKCNPMKYCAPSPPPPLSLFSCCEIKYVSEERAMGPRYRGNYQPGDGHYSAIGAVTGVGRIAALYRVCYDCGTLMYSSLIARVSLYYLYYLYCFHCFTICLPLPMKRLNCLQ